MALLGFVLAACHKNQPTADTTGGKPQEIPLATKLRESYGFAVQVPANSEGYAAFYKLGKLWKDIKQSKTVASIRANPLVRRMTDDPSVKKAKADFQANPEAAKWRAIVAEALGNEAFVELAPGCGEKIRMLLQLNEEMRVARLKNILAGKMEMAPDMMVPLLLPYVKKLDLPPIVLGFKITSQKAALNAEIEKGEKNLPPGVELTAFNLNESLPFKSLVVTVGKVVPPPLLEQMKMAIAKMITDPQSAEDVYQSILTRRVEVAYGFAGDYFIASIGPDHSHLKLAANFGESLLSKPEVAVAGNYYGKPILSFSWTSAELLSSAQQRFDFATYYEHLKQDIAKALSPADTQQLETDLKRLDQEGNTVFTRNFVPMVGVSYREHGIHSEVYGGLKVTDTVSPVKFSAVPPASTFLWVDGQSDTALGNAFRAWFEDLVSTAYGTFQRVGMPLLPSQQRMQFSYVQMQVVPRITEFYKITRDQFAKSLGTESAFALDLDAAMPDVPLIPPPIHDGGRMLRLAYLSDVQDAALLGESWKNYLKLARDVAQLVPQSPVLQGGIPDPSKETVDGVTLSYYALPMKTGDLLPNVATTDKTFVVSTSRSYALELSKAASQASVTDKALVFNMRMNFLPAFDFVDKWMGLAGQYPDLFFQGNQQKGDEYKKSQGDVTALLHSLRSVQGMDMQIFQDHGVRRVSSAIRVQE